MQTVRVWGSQITAGEFDFRNHGNTLFSNSSYHRHRFRDAGTFDHEFGFQYLSQRMTVFLERNPLFDHLRSVRFAENARIGKQHFVSFRSGQHGGTVSALAAAQYYCQCHNLVFYPPANLIFSGLRPIFYGKYLKPARYSARPLRIPTALRPAETSAGRKNTGENCRYVNCI